MRALGATLTFCLIACSASPARDAGLDAGLVDAGIVSGPTALAFLDQFLALTTRRQVECGFSLPDASAEWVALRVRDEVDVRAEMSRNRFFLDAEQAASCLSQLARARCEFLEVTLTLSCLPALHSQAQSGQPCRVDEDCVVADDVCAGPSCERTCVRGGLVAGGVCNRQHRCAPGLTCHDLRCAPLIVAAAGQFCGGLTVCDAQNVCDGGTCSSRSSLGAPCSASFPCVEGAFCNDAFRCEALRPFEAGCSRDDDCASGQCFRAVDAGFCGPAEGEPCVNFACANTATRQRTCELETLTCRAQSPLRLPVRASRACLLSSGLCAVETERCFATDGGQVGLCHAPAVGDVCQTHFDCGADQHCAAGQCAVSALGSPCDDSRNCPATLGCDAASRTCLARPAVGAACVDFCAAGAACIGGQCVALGTEGATCAGLGSCKLPFECDPTRGRCVHAAATGELCASLDGCVSGTCISNVCAAPISSGAFCVYSRQCASGTCRLSDGDGPYGTCGPACP